MASGVDLRLPSSHARDGAAGPIRQSETHPISNEQRVAEVNKIYAGLVIVESKCMEVDDAQNNLTSTLNNEQWQALAAVHQVLLNQHYDFFLASQHPSASPALRGLASKYAMPARMWRHGIYTFLELLRHRLPSNLEHLLAFIHTAYSMVTLLYETVPAFEVTWLQCLGDLASYRMAIDDGSFGDREVWVSVSMHWYTSLSDKAPTIGRPHHHLALLSPPSSLQQLYHYVKSLCVAAPFAGSRESILTLFDSACGSKAGSKSRLTPELAFIQAHGMIIGKQPPKMLDFPLNELERGLDGLISRSTQLWREPGYYIGLSNLCAITGYSDESNPIYTALRQARGESSPDQPKANSEMGTVAEELASALELANRTHRIVLRRSGDTNILPYLHVTLVFIHHLTYHPEAMAYIAPKFPWDLTAVVLNKLMRSISHSRIRKIQSAHAVTNIDDNSRQLPRPLPEDYAMRGLLWAEGYFPETCFSGHNAAENYDRYSEVASMTEERKERILWLGCRIAANPNVAQLTYHCRRFSERRAKNKRKRKSKDEGRKREKRRKEGREKTDY